jgi:ankyrin repeat protein
MAAAERGLEKMGFLLLQRGAHPAPRDADGFTPLLLAASAGCAGLVSKLLNAGVDPNAVDESEELVAMSRAAEYDHVAVVELLLARGVSPNVDDRTLLCALRDRDRSEEAGSDGYRLIRTLVQHGADVFMDGWTDERPLVIAAEHGLTDVVELFLQAEFTSTRIRQEHIRNAVCVAAEEGEKEILKMLMEHYVRCDTNSEHETPWEWAKNYEFGQSLELLRPYFSPDPHGRDDSDSS